MEVRKFKNPLTLYIMNIFCSRS